MNVLAQKWVEALRSGEFSQTRGCLRDGEGHCCLGVACELFVPESEKDTSQSLTYYMNAGGKLPDAVMQALGLRTHGGNFQNWLGRSTSLAERNDSGATFEEIADIIEAEPEGLFA